MSTIVQILREAEVIAPNHSPEAMEAAVLRALLREQSKRVGSLEPHRAAESLERRDGLDQPDCTGLAGGRAGWGV